MVGGATRADVTFYRVIDARWTMRSGTRLLLRSEMMGFSLAQRPPVATVVLVLDRVVAELGTPM
jgi:hypothetical protein